MKKEYKKYDIGLIKPPKVDFSISKERRKEKKEQTMPKNSEEGVTSAQKKSASAGRRQQKTGKIVMCSYCGEVFFAKGTRRYCYGDECQKAEKRYRQSIVDGLAAAVKKGLYANFKLFSEVLPESGQTKIDYDLALRKRFDEDAFYGTYRVGDFKWRVVEDYYFFIEHKDDKRFLHIYKK